MSNKVTYADVALINEGGRIYAGVELLRRIQLDDGRSDYEQYHVISFAGAINLPSIKRVIPILLTEALAYVDPSHEVVIFRSFNRAFERSTAIEGEVGLGRKVTVKVVYVPYNKFIRNHGLNTLLLANDALRRGYTLEVAV